MSTLFGIENRFLDATLSATSEKKPVSNLTQPLGGQAYSWETEVGVREASLLLSLPASVSWRAFLLARTNLSPTAEVRWSVGTAAGVIPETPAVSLVFSEDFTAPGTGSWSFTRASPSWRRRADLSWEEVADNVPAIHHDVNGLCLGCLFQPSHTNVIRNSRFEGAVPGSPGTLPTNCAQDAGGFTAGIAEANAFEDGLPAVVWQLSGSPVGATQATFWFETITNLAAVQNDVIELRVFANIAAGNLTNLSAIRLGFDEYTAASALIGGGGAYVDIPLSSLRLGSQVYEARLTAPSATCAYVRPFLRAVTVSGGAVALSIRVSCPFARKNGSHLPTVPVTPPVGAPASATRAAETMTYAPVASLMTFGNMSVYIESMAVSSESTSPAANQVSVRVDDGNAGHSNDNLTMRSYTPSAGSQATNWFARLAGTIVVQTVNRTVSSLVPVRNVARISPDVGFKRWIGAFLDTDSDRPTATLTTIRAAAPPTTSFALKELRIYSKQLTDNQCLQLVTDGQSYDSAGVSYTTGWVPADVAQGYGQSVKVFPSSQPGSCARCDIRDLSNTEGLLRVGLAFAGDAWELRSGVSWGSQFTPESRELMFSTRGGQEHVEPLFRRRGWSITLDALKLSDSWSYKNQLESQSAAGRNVLFIPDDANDLPYAPVFGLIRTSGDSAPVGREYSLKSWNLSIMERV